MKRKEVILSLLELKGMAERDFAEANRKHDGALASYMQGKITAYGVSIALISANKEAMQILRGE